MIEKIVEFFRRDQHGDMLFFKTGGFWGSPWTVAPHDPENAANIAEQYVHMKADGLRHAERVVLRSADGSTEEVAVITDLPMMRQTVVVIDSGEEKKHLKAIRTETLSAISSAIQTVAATATK